MGQERYVVRRQWRILKLMRNSVALSKPGLCRLLAIWLVVAMGLLVCNIAGVYAIAKGYRTDDTLLTSGMVVAVEASDSSASKVVRASQDTASKVVGIATPIDDSAVAITSSDADVYVESQGVVWAYVTDINGEVKRGDLLTVSPLRGMLMRTTTDAGGAIVAIADDNFTSAQAESVTLDSGKTAKVAKILINLDQKNVSGGQAQQSALQKIGRSVTGRTVSDVRVLVAMVIFIIVMIAEAAIIYGGITSAITAIGRNPLAQKYIKKELFQVLGIVFGVLLLGVATIYGILWI